MLPTKFCMYADTGGDGKYTSDDMIVLDAGTMDKMAGVYLHAD